MNPIVCVYTLLITCAACAPAHRSGSEDIYHNSRIGITLKKPPGWHFVSKQQSLRNRENTEILDEELEQAVVENENLPTVSVAKYQDPHPTINPTVQVKHLSNAGAEISPQGALSSAKSAMQSGVADFEVLVPIQDARLDGYDAARMEVAFTMSTRDGGTFAVRSLMWVVRRVDDLFVIGMSSPRQGEDVSDEEFQLILSSIRLARRD